MPKITFAIPFAIVVVCLCVMLSVAAAADKQVVPTQQNTPIRQSPVSPVNGITQAAVKAGVLVCTSRVNQVATFLTADVQGVSAMLFMPLNNPDQHLISVSLEIPQKEAFSAYASASFAPNQANGCGGMYETVVYWPQKCDEVAHKTFGALKKIEGFSKNLTVLDGGIWTKIFLMPAGSGCVSIKKEVVQ